MAQIKDLVISRLTGGQNDQDPAAALPLDQCVLMRNVELFNTTLGERRNGCEATNITGSGLDDEDGIVHLNTHLPSGVELPDSEIWAVGATEDTSITISQRSGVTWTEITPIDALENTFPAALQIQSQSLHGKLFIAYQSADATDRLHVWDGTTLRRAGLAAPIAAPTAADDAGGGAFAGARTYRVRFIEKSGSTVLRRSEPSAELTHTPPGTKIGVTVTRPAVVSEGETDWELEASSGDGFFWVIATTVIATTTYDDQTQPATNYANTGDLSEDIGEYDLIESVKFVKADQDRLIFAGSWETEAHNSRVSWSPAWASTGVGNDERIPLLTDNFLDLDWMDGGGLTGLSDPLNGSFYAFKYNRIYKLQRTGQASQAYQAVLLSKARGAIPGSIVSGVDELGQGCIYFLDPSIGPSRVTGMGLQHIRNLRGTWVRTNTIAEKVAAHGVYYPDKQQVKWWVAIDGSDTPELMLVLQTNEVRSETEFDAAYDNPGRGWTTADGLLATAWCSCIVPERVLTDNGSYTLNFRPYIGLPSPNFIQRTDVGFDDNGTPFIAKIITKPYFLTGLINRWGAKRAALLAESIDDPDTRLSVKLLRNYGMEESDEWITDFVPDGDEDAVIRDFDNLHLSDSKAIQIVFSDPE